jgi:hypothetical protein
MRNCRKCRALFVDGLYADLGPREKRFLDAHLTKCPDCEAAYAELRSTLQVMDRRERVSPDSEFWEEYWERLEPHLATPPREKRRTALRWGGVFETLRYKPTWVYRLAIGCALVAAGVMIGLYFGSVPEQPVAPEFRAEGSSPSAAVTLAQAHADRYIERSKVLLLGLVNFDPATEDTAILDLSRQQRISRDLVRDAVSLKAELSETDQVRLRRLIEDLEVILLQIANVESKHDLSMIEMVKSGVDRRGILLKINLEEMRRWEGKATPANESLDTVKNKI